MSIRLNRRTFMRLLGAAPAGFGALGARPAWSQSASGGPPLRFLFVYAEGGSVPRATFMRPRFAPASWGDWSDLYRRANTSGEARLPDNNEFEFSFTDPQLQRSDMSRVLDPFWDVRSKMVCIEGLAKVSSGWDDNGDGHAQNHLATMTGGPSAYGYDGVKSHALHPSLDQRVLEHLRSQDPGAFSLNFRPGHNRDVGTGTNGFHYFLYSRDSSGAIRRHPTEGSPERAFRRLFGDTDIGNESDADAFVRRRATEAVFGLIQDELRDMSQRLSGSRRARVETHRALVDQIERGLLSEPVATSCSRPSVAPVNGLDRSTRFERDWHSFSDIVTAAFACNLTQVATISIQTVPPEAYGLPAGASIHQEYEHRSDPMQYHNPDRPASQTAIAAEEGMIQRNLHHARLVERLVRALDQVPEGDGTLLDNTIVLYASELAHGNHGFENQPFLVFGGSNSGALRTGRYLKYPFNGRQPWGRNYLNRYTGVPHNLLYNSLLQGMGLDVDYIHQPSLPGWIPNVDETRRPINMSGPLPRLA